MEQSTPSTSTEPALESASPLSELEVRAIDLCINAVKVAGLPKSIGEIYGLLYLSPEPIPLSDFVERLQISKGSASQGLRFLRNLGAVKTTYVPGDRRDHFVAQLDLRELITGFLREQLLPHLEGGSERLDVLRELAASDPSENRAFYQERVELLGSWQKRARQLMTLVKTFVRK